MVPKFPPYTHTYTVINKSLFQYIFFFFKKFTFLRKHIKCMHEIIQNKL